MTDLRLFGSPSSSWYQGAVQIETLADWDRSPPREILASLLIKRQACVHGDPSLLEAELDLMAQAGLAEHRLPAPDELAEVTRAVDRGVAQPGPFWLVRSTDAGRVVGIRVAHSFEILGALMAFARIVVCGGDWKGASPDALIRELDLRDGGSGNVDNPGRWLQIRGDDHVNALRRRFGLDPAPAEEGSDCRAS